MHQAVAQRAGQRLAEARQAGQHLHAGHQRCALLVGRHRLHQRQQHLHGLRGPAQRLAGMGQAQAHLDVLAEELQAALVHQRLLVAAAGCIPALFGPGQVSGQRDALIGQQAGLAAAALERHALLQLAQQREVAGQQGDAGQEQLVVAAPDGAAVAALRVVQVVQQALGSGQRFAALAAPGMPQRACGAGEGGHRQRRAQPALVFFGGLQRAQGGGELALPQQAAGLRGQHAGAQCAGGVAGARLRALHIALQHGCHAGQGDEGRQGLAAAPDLGAVGALQCVDAARVAGRQAGQVAVVEHVPGAQQLGQGQQVIGQGVARQRLDLPRRFADQPLPAQRDGVVHEAALRRVGLPGVPVRLLGAVHRLGHAGKAPAGPGGNALDEIERRRLLAPRGGKLLEQPQHAVDRTGPDQRRCRFFQHRLRRRPLAAAQQVADAALRVGLGVGGAAQQLRQLARALAGQPVFQTVAEQAVQREGCLGAFGRFAVEHRDEEAARFGLFEQGLRVGVAGDRGAARGRQLGQHRRAQQEQAQVGGQRVQHLAHQVVEGVPVGRAARAAGAGVEREPQAGGPALRALPQRLDLRAGLVDFGELARFLGREAQVFGAELGQLAERTQPRQGHRRVDAAGDDQRPVRGQALEQQVAPREDGRVADAVRVFEHDHARPFVAGKRVEHRVDGAALGLALRPGGAHDGVGRHAPRQVEGLERGAQAVEHAVQVIVFVGRHPGERRVRRPARQHAGEQGGLAEAGGGAQQHQPGAGQRVGQALLQARARDQVAARARRLDLGECEARGVHGRAAV